MVPSSYTMYLRPEGLTSFLKKVSSTVNLCWIWMFVWVCTHYTELVSLKQVIDCRVRVVSVSVVSPVLKSFHFTNWDSFISSQWECLKSGTDGFGYLEKEEGTTITVQTKRVPSVRNALVWNWDRYCSGPTSSPPRFLEVSTASLSKSPETSQTPFPEYEQ